MTLSIFLTTMYGSLGQGLLYAPVAIGVYLSLRIMKRPDLTIEGSFAFGAVIVPVMSAYSAKIRIVEPFGHCV